MNCEICGKTEALYNVSIEGTELKVCRDCVKYGKVMESLKTNTAQPQRHFQPLPKIEQQEEEETIIENYSVLIKNAREKLGLSQEDFAKKINEKVSLVHKLETGAFEPPIEMAKKIERFLRIRIVAKAEEAKEKPSKKTSDVLTIGDVLKIKK